MRKIVETASGRSVTLEQGGHFINEESNSQLTQDFHENNGADVLNTFGGVLGDGNESFPLPGVRDGAIFQYLCKAFIRFHTLSRPTLASIVRDACVEVQEGLRKRFLVLTSQLHRSSERTEQREVVGTDLHGPLLGWARNSGQTRGRVHRCPQHRGY